MVMAIRRTISLTVGPFQSKLWILLILSQIPYVTIRSAQMRETQQKIQAVIQKIIGDKDKCTLAKASIEDDGTYIGGPKFERHERAVHVIGAERAYTLGPSHERIPN